MGRVFNLNDWRGGPTSTLLAGGKFELARGRIVLAHGCWDLLHCGHLEHLEQAKALGDLLVVTVTPDRFVRKGPGRPVYGEEERARLVAALACVDYAAVNLWPTAVETIQLLRPAVYAKGQEYDGAMTPELRNEALACDAVGCKLVYTASAGEHSTTRTVERVRECRSAGV